MKVERESKMELTLDNLVNYILNEESSCYVTLLKYEEEFGTDSSATSRARARWGSHYKIAKEFGFSDKLKR